MVEFDQSYFNNIVSGIIGNAYDWEPFRRDMGTKIKSCDLDLGAFPAQALGCSVKSRAPTALLDFLIYWTDVDRRRQGQSFLRQIVRLEA